MWNRKDTKNDNLRLALSANCRTDQMIQTGVSNELSPAYCGHSCLQTVLQPQQDLCPPLPPLPASIRDSTSRALERPLARFFLALGPFHLRRLFFAWPSSHPTLASYRESFLSFALSRNIMAPGVLSINMSIRSPANVNRDTSIFVPPISSPHLLTAADILF